MQNLQALGAPPQDPRASSGWGLRPQTRAWFGMEWNGKWNEMKRKFWYGIWKMPEWNGIFQEWNGRQSSILPYQFHTRFCALYLQKNRYRCQVVTNNIVIEVFNFSICAYYFRQIVVLWLCTLPKQCTYCIIASTLQFNCSIDVTVDDLDRFDWLFLLF